MNNNQNKERFQNSLNYMNLSNSPPSQIPTASLNPISREYQHPHLVVKANPVSVMPFTITPNGNYLTPGGTVYPPPTNKQIIQDQFMAYNPDISSFNLLKYEQNVFENSFKNAKSGPGTTSDSSNFNSLNDSDISGGGPQYTMDHSIQGQQQHSTTINSYSLTNSTSGFQNQYFTGPQSVQYVAVNNQTGYMNVIPSYTVQLPHSSGPQAQQLVSSTLQSRAMYNGGLPYTSNDTNSYSQSVPQSIDPKMFVSQNNYSFGHQQYSTYNHQNQIIHNGSKVHQYNQTNDVKAEPNQTSANQELRKMQSTPSVVNRKHTFQRKSIAYPKFEAEFQQQREKIEKDQIQEIERSKKNITSLEKNRIAAQRCRDRKKAWITALEQQMQNTLNENTKLLKQQDSILKKINAINAALRHSSQVSCPAKQM